MDNETLNLAYKYPFSSFAKKILFSEKDAGTELKYLEFAKERIEFDMKEADSRDKKGSRYYNIDIDSIKLGEIKAYVYSRMVVSVIANPLVLDKFCRGEEMRSFEALKEDSNENIIKIAEDIGIKLNENKEHEFLIDFDCFLKNSPDGEGFRLVNNKINRGIVILSRIKIISVLSEAIFRRIREKLPIPIRSIPKDVVDYSKTLGIGVNVEINRNVFSGRTEWIEKLINIPIADARHRTVNLILAPYFVNVKRLEPKQAYVIIKEYIEKCKKINPDTRINDSYIMYQCKYSKEHKLRPLSFIRGKSLLEGMINFRSGKKGENDGKNGDM